MSDKINRGLEILNRFEYTRLDSFLCLNQKSVVNEIIRLEEQITRLQGEMERYKNAVIAINELINNSNGVDGLHLNGDVAPWEELVLGGRFEEWLTPLSFALEQLHEADDGNI